jgi:two-component system, sensor histidine kinase PdtaS
MAFMAGYSQSALKVSDRAWLYVTELLHRFENEYTKAISYASLIATRSPNPEARAALYQVIDHLHASAKAHRILRPPVPGEFVDFTADLAQLCRTLVSTGLDQHGIALHLAVSGSVRLDAIRSWCANLILSELITNASRHAFGAAGGRILVSIAATSGQIVCRVSDDGSSSSTPKPGLGTQLVDALTADLDGNIERNYAAFGTEVTLSFPTKPESHFDF